MNFTRPASGKPRGRSWANSSTETRGIVVSFGLPVFYQDGVYDAACLACDGRIAG